MVSVFLFGSRAPIRGIKGQQSQGRKEDRADERPPCVSAKGQGMLQGLFDAVPSDEPAEDRRDTEVGDERPRPDPGQRIGHEHGEHDQHRDDGSQRQQHQREDCVWVQLPNVLWQAPQGEEEVAHGAVAPAKLLLEQDRDLVGNSSPAERVGVDVGAIAAQQRLMRQEAVFALVDWDAEPMAAADCRFNLQQQLAADGEQAAADAADAACPVLGDFVEVER